MLRLGGVGLIGTFDRGRARGEVMAKGEVVAKGDVGDVVASLSHCVGKQVSIESLAHNGRNDGAACCVVDLSVGNPGLALQHLLDSCGARAARHATNRKLTGGGGFQWLRTEERVARFLDSHLHGDKVGAGVNS